MKKGLFFIILLVLPFFVDAQCTYKEKYELNAMSSYIDYNYDYNEERGLFTLTLTNIDEKLEIRYENLVLNPENGKVVFENIEPGSRLSINVYSTVENECYDEHLRVLYVSIPYFNRFYNSILCDGHETLDICNARFLDYPISNETFILLLNNHEFTLNKEEEKPNDVENVKWYDRIIRVVNDYYLGAIISTVSTILSVSIYSVVYRKVKHKL